MARRQESRGFRNGVREVRAGRQYEVKIYWRVNGRRGSKSEMVYGTLTEARAHYTQLKAETGRGGAQKSRHILLNDYLDQYLARADIRLSTKESMERQLGCYVRPRFGEVPLAAITSLDLERHYADMRTGAFNGRPLAPNTVAMTHRYLRSILSDAVRHGCLAQNAAQAVKIRREREPKRAWSTLDKEQLKIFLSTADASRSRWALLFHVLAIAGLRIGEAVGLQWDDIDFNKGYVMIRRSVTRSKREGWVDDLPKGGQIRAVRLPSGLLERLSAQRRHSSPTSKWVFSSPNGQDPACKRSVDRAFKRVLRLAGLPDMRLHDLRHTHATLLNGQHSLKAVQERLGHSDIQTTLNFYIHSNPAHDLAIAQDLQEAFYDERK